MAPSARLGGRTVEALLFDYGLTLVSFTRSSEALLRAHEEVIRRLRAAGVGPLPSAATLLAEVHDRVENAVARHEATGALREIDAVVEERHAYAALGIRLSDELSEVVAALVQQAWWERVAVSPATVATLEELRRRGLRLGICSNAPYRAVGLRLQLAHLGLAGLFDSVTFSSEIGWRKPAPQIFAAALGALGVEASLCAMVGDRRREDIAGARSAGMATIRTREHRDDPGPGDADAVIDRISDLAELLFPPQNGGNRGSVAGDDTSR
jgi:putative hydrolase of the HAD superfamily